MINARKRQRRTREQKLVFKIKVKKLPRLTIAEIKLLSYQDSPEFFTHKTMKFFGQRMRDFKVVDNQDGRYKFFAPRMIDGRHVGYTERFFNPANNKLEIN